MGHVSLPPYLKRHPFTSRVNEMVKDTVSRQWEDLLLQRGQEEEV